MWQRIIEWLLSWWPWGRKIDAAIDAVQAESAQEDAEAAAQLQQKLGEIDHETAEQEAGVDSTADADLPDRLDVLSDAAEAHNRERR